MSLVISIRKAVIKLRTVGKLLEFTVGIVKLLVSLK